MTAVVNRSSSPIEPKTERQLRTAAEKVRTLEHRSRDAAAERDRLIREAIAHGATLRAVAETTGLSHSAIRLITNRNTSVGES